LEAANAAGASFDTGFAAAAREAAASGERREVVRRVNLASGRRALRATLQPLEGGGVGVWTEDVTDAEEAGEGLARPIAAKDQTLNLIGDAVVVFDRARRLSFCNGAFADLWALEPAWLAEHPTHAELLDRLRLRRRLPETVDYASFKAAELARYEQIAPSQQQ